jgi:hypothetical protein
MLMKQNSFFLLDFSINSISYDYVPLGIILSYGVYAHEIHMTIDPRS